MSRLDESSLEWSAAPSEKLKTKADSRTTEKSAPGPATVGQARLDVMMMGDPSHAHSLLTWTGKLRADKSWTERELAEAFLTLTEKISVLQMELQEADLEAAGTPWLEKWRKSQRLAGKRDAIMDELKHRGRAKAIYFCRRVGATLTPSSEPPSETMAPESDPFENC